MKLWVRWGLKTEDGAPFVQIMRGQSAIATLDAAEAFAFAHELLDAAGDAHTDAFLVKFFRNTLGMSEAEAMGGLLAFQKFRDASAPTQESAPEEQATPPAAHYTLYKGKPTGAGAKIEVIVPSDRVTLEDGVETAGAGTIEHEGIVFDVMPFDGPIGQTARGQIFTATIVGRRDEPSQDLRTHDDV